MKRLSLPLRNLAARPGRTAALIVLTALLAAAVFGGSLIVRSLEGGLDSLESRLGADVIVVPVSAASKSDLQNMLLQGTVGYFYMDSGVLDKVRGMAGVETASPQLFLASLRADCCSIPVQMIGFDRETDFTVTPWMRERYSGDLQDLQVIVGSRVNAAPGTSIKIYGENCKVAARLSETGTGLDTAVYGSMETLRSLLDAARGLGHDLKISGDPDKVISAVYIKVRDGYDAESVANDINLHVRKVKAIRTRSMMSDVSGSLSSIAGIVSVLAAAVWVMGFVVLFVAFSAMTRERKGEFAVLRVIGMTRRALAGMALKEAVLIGAAGALLGIGLSAIVVLPFTALIESRLGLPFLVPEPGRLLLIGALTLAGLVAAVCLASAVGAVRLSRADTADILREGN
ncbi:MAG: ABC transporter permease [Clostridia bacterium]|nr:ABC transporter permease [Clostridia bacterium]